jgi:hypothetical protein
MPFGVLATSLEKVDVYQLMKEAFSVANLQSFIKETIENRLFSKGTTGSGKKLQTDNSKRQNTKAYSLFTEYLRESKGLPINRVTLKDEGDLYESFKIFLRDDGFVTQFNWENQKYYQDGNGIYDNFKLSYSNEYDFYNDVESLTNDELDMVALRIYNVFEKKLDAIF